MRHLKAVNKACKRQDPDSCSEVIAYREIIKQLVDAGERVATTLLDTTTVESLKHFVESGCVVVSRDEAFSPVPAVVPITGQVIEEKVSPAEKVSHIISSTLELLLTCISKTKVASDIAFNFGGNRLENALDSSPNLHHFRFRCASDPTFDSSDARTTTPRTLTPARVFASPAGSSSEVRRVSDPTSNQDATNDCFLQLTGETLAHFIAGVEVEESKLDNKKRWMTLLRELDASCFLGRWPSHARLEDFMRKHNLDWVARINGKWDTTPKSSGEREAAYVQVFKELFFAPNADQIPVTSEALNHMWGLNEDGSDKEVIDGAVVPEDSKCTENNIQLCADGFKELACATSVDDSEAAPTYNDVDDKEATLIHNDMGGDEDVDNPGNLDAPAEFDAPKVKIEVEEKVGVEEDIVDKAELSMVDLLGSAGSLEKNDHIFPCLKPDETAAGSEAEQEVNSATGLEVQEEVQASAELDSPKLPQNLCQVAVRPNLHATAEDCDEDCSTDPSQAEEEAAGELPLPDVDLPVSSHVAEGSNGAAEDGEVDTYTTDFASDEHPPASEPRLIDVIDADCGEAELPHEFDYETTDKDHDKKADGAHREADDHQDPDDAQEIDDDQKAGDDQEASDDQEANDDQEAGYEQEADDDEAPSLCNSDNDDSLSEATESEIDPEEVDDFEVAVGTGEAQEVSDITFEAGLAQDQSLPIPLIILTLPDGTVVDIDAQPPWKRKLRARQFIYDESRLAPPARPKKPSTRQLRGPTVQCTQPGCERCVKASLMMAAEKNLAGRIEHLTEMQGWLEELKKPDVDSDDEFKGGPPNKKDRKRAAIRAKRVAEMEASILAEQHAVEILTTRIETEKNREADSPGTSTEGSEEKSTTSPGKQLQVEPVVAKEEKPQTIEENSTAKSAPSSAAPSTANLSKSITSEVKVSRTTPALLTTNAVDPTYTPPQWSLTPIFTGLAVGAIGVTVCCPLLSALAFTVGAITLKSRLRT